MKTEFDARHQQSDLTAYFLGHEFMELVNLLADEEEEGKGRGKYHKNFNGPPHLQYLTPETQRHLCLSLATLALDQVRGLHDSLYIQDFWDKYYNADPLPEVPSELNPNDRVVNLILIPVSAANHKNLSTANLTTMGRAIQNAIERTDAQVRFRLEPLGSSPDYGASPERPFTQV